MRRLAPIAAAALAALCACDVDTDIPADALLSCTDDAYCPEGWSCDAVEQLCVPPGRAPGDSDLEAVLTAACGATYDKAQACAAEVEATLGEAAALFDQGRDDFVSACVAEQIDTVTEEELATLAAAEDLLPSLSCGFFAGYLCDNMDLSGYATNCP